jgi:hypothetical protein
MPRRIKPYESKPVTWKTIIDKELFIPMNQRNYEWNNDTIEKFLTDIKEIYEEDKYVERMGSIIIFKDNNDNHYIYDGQQRTITTLLLLYCISLLDNEIGTDIKKLIFHNKLHLDRRGTKKQKTQLKKGYRNIPKLKCVNPNDNTALIEIFNNKYVPKIKLYKKENDLFKCLHKECDVTTKRESDMKRHYLNVHESDLSYLKKYSTISSVYNAYEYILEYLYNLDYSAEKLYDLYGFIIEDIDIQLFTCDNEYYVSKIFDWENNMGQKLDAFDIIKNNFIMKVSDDNKMDVYEKWERLINININDLIENRDNKYIISIKDYGKKIFALAIHFYNKEISRVFYKDKDYNKLLSSDNVYNEILTLFDIIIEINKIIVDIHNDKYGRLLPLLNISYECYIWLILPVFYFTKNKTNKINLLKLVVKWGIRNYKFKSRPFNNVSYSNTFLNIANAVINNKEYDYLTKLKKCFNDNNTDTLSEDNYELSLLNKRYKNNDAKPLLLFLETETVTDISIVPLNYDLEHIHPKSIVNDEITNEEICMIGNHTLLESKNSSNGHTGNKGLGNTSYENKCLSYSDSNCKLTNKIVNEYKIFGKNEILHRTKKIAALLNKLTLYN